jgi:hypothetical protein
MPIQIKCACGKSLQAKDELAGKKVRCPGCAAILIAPPAQDAIVPAIDAAPPRKTPPPLKFEEDEQTAVTEKPTVKAQGKSSHDYDDDEVDDDRGYPRKKRRRRSPDRLHTSDGGTSNSVLAGVGLMAAGVVLFVVPLAFGFIWYYSIVLFIAGVVTVVKGALNR